MRHNTVKKQSFIPIHQKQGEQRSVLGCPPVWDPRVKPQDTASVSLTPSHQIKYMNDNYIQLEVGAVRRAHVSDCSPPLSGRIGPHRGPIPNRTQPVASPQTSRRSSIFPSSYFTRILDRLLLSTNMARGRGRGRGRGGSRGDDLTYEPPSAPAGGESWLHALALLIGMGT